MADREDDLRPRPGRGRGGGGRAVPKSFVGQVLRATRAAGGAAGPPCRVTGTARTPAFGRGRGAALTATCHASQRRVLVKVRVVRHRGVRFRAGTLATHFGYLGRDGVGRDGAPAALFDRAGEAADGGAFGQACEGDRHHFRFIVSPEDATATADLRGFTRELMAQAEHDLGTRLDWVAAEHWNTDNPHVHVLVRGRTDSGADLVIGRDYIGAGLRARAEALVTLELGPRSAREIATALDSEIGAERWTGLDRTLHRLGADTDGVVDLRPGAAGDRDRGGGNTGHGDADADQRRRLIGRAQSLARLGLAEPLGPAVWRLKPGFEATLRDLGTRGDILARMHRAMAGGVERPDADFALGERPGAPILGRLVARGLDDELAGSAWVVIDATDGRIHHLRLPDLEATGDTAPGGIVEARMTVTRPGTAPMLQIVGRSDLALKAQIGAKGATWLDRVRLAREPVPLAQGGFGAEVRAALEARADHLAALGLARRQGGTTTFAPDLIGTLRRRELAAVTARLAASSGLPHSPGAEGETVAGTYRRRLDLASGRFAMLDDGLGFQLVPWRPALEPHLDRQVSGTLTPGGGIDWDLGRKRGLGV